MAGGSSPLDRVASKRMGEFFAWSLEWKPWGSFTEEEVASDGPLGPLGFFGHRYLEALPRFMRKMCEQREATIAACGTPLQWSTISTHWNALTRWARQQITFLGELGSPPLMIWAQKTMDNVYAQVRAKGLGVQVVWPSGMDMGGGSASAAGSAGPASPNLQRTPRPRPRTYKTDEDHSEDGTLFPGDDPLPREAISPEAPWWIRLMFMPVYIPLPGFTIEVPYAPRVSELKDLSYFPSGDGNYIDLQMKCLCLKKFKNASHREMRVIPLTDDMCEMFETMKTQPSLFTRVPNHPNTLLETWLRPAVELYYGVAAGDPGLSETIRITNIGLRTMAFNSLMDQVMTQGMERMRPCDWLIINIHMQMLHDHSFNTALLSYTKRMSPEAVECLRNHWKKTWVKANMPKDTDANDFCVDVLRALGDVPPQRPSKTPVTPASPEAEDDSDGECEVERISPRSRKALDFTCEEDDELPDVLGGGGKRKREGESQPPVAALTVLL